MSDLGSTVVIPDWCNCSPLSVLEESEVKDIEDHLFEVYIDKVNPDEPKLCIGIEYFGITLPDRCADELC